MTLAAEGSGTTASNIDPPRSMKWFERIRFRLDPGPLPAVVWRATLIFLPLALLTTLSFVQIYRTQATASRSLMMAGQEKLVELGDITLSGTLNSIANDVHFLVEEPTLAQWMDTDDPDAKRTLVQQYMSFVQHRALYDQLRFIDLEGREVIRIEYNSGSPVSVPAYRLQDQSGRDYVTEGLKLRSGGIYLSPFDLELEEGAFEHAVRPTMRLASPVFGSDRTMRGLLVLNYRGERPLSRVRALSTEGLGSVWLLNRAGAWLIGPEPDEWTVMYPDRQSRTFAALYPEAWERTRTSGHFSQFALGDDLFSISAISVPEGVRTGETQESGSDPSAYLYLVAHAPAAVFTGPSSTLAWQTLGAGAGALLLLAGVAVAIAHHGEQRRQAERKIQELAQRLRHDNAALASVNQELEAFSYSVSHDLRAPLRSIDGFSRILLKQHAASLGEEARDFLQSVRDNAIQMGRLVDDLLAFSRLGRKPLKKREVDVAELVEQAMRDSGKQAEDRKVVTTIGETPSVMGDPSLLKQVFVNLIDNAFKYTRTRDEARIEVGSENVNGETVFFVRDNGAGFDMRYADKLFGVFQRLHRAEDFEGTGVGLAIVQRIIHRHGGRIWAEAAVDRGATFHFTLEVPDNGQPAL